MLKYFPVFVHSNGECHPDALDTAYRSVGATAVDSRSLSPALNHDSSFQCVLDFDLERPFGLNELLLREH